MSIYNFRIDRDRRSFILNNLKNQNELSQGWGMPQFNLHVDCPTFVQDTKSQHKLATTRVPTNLTTMKVFKDNDILVVPHLPDNNLVTIVVVDGDYPACYRYDMNDIEYLNHRIKVKRVYGLNGNISMNNHRLAAYYGKLQWLRLPIINLWFCEDEIRGVIKELEQNPSVDLGPSALNQYLEDVFQEVITSVKAKLSNISPSNSSISFEKVCEYVLTDNGYNVESRNQYSNGGDADLVCVLKEKPSPFVDRDDRLCVQIKKHSGTTDEYAVKQLIIAMSKLGPSTQGCVITLADGFDNKAVSLAKKDAIQLITGSEIASMLIATWFSK